MDTDRLFSVAVGLILLAGIGTTATSLQTSVDTTPDEAIDIDSASLPVGADDFGRFDGENDGSKSGSDSGGDGGGSAKADSDSQRGGSAESESGGGGDESRAGSREGAGDRQSKRVNDGPQKKQSDGGSKTTEGKGDPDEQSFLEWLLSLLRSLLALLVDLLPLILLVGLAAVAVSQRERVAAALSRFTDRGADDDPDGPSPRPAPTNDVAQAWYEMAALVDADVSRTASPRECASRAVAAGADRAAVERVTSAFEEVRYGHEAVTPERRQRAREGIADVRAQLGVDR